MIGLQPTICADRLHHQWGVSRQQLGEVTRLVRREMDDDDVRRFGRDLDASKERLKRLEASR
jgi:hypothetical protein